MRDLQIVIPTTGRSSCAAVVRDSLGREIRLSRLTVVNQSTRAIVDGELRAEAERRGVLLEEVALNQRVGPSQARHIGAVRGDEEFVGFVDDDIVFERGTLSALASRCREGGLGGAGGVLAVGETGRFAQLMKRVLFRSIFRDPRPSAGRRRKPQRTAILSGGMAVYRRSVYLPCAAQSVDFPVEYPGEDVELSFAVARRAPLVLDPSVRVRNTVRETSCGPRDPAAAALAHLDRYRRFADRHATTGRHWLAYGGVLVGVLARGLALGAGPPFVREVVREAQRAARNTRAYRQGNPNAHEVDAAEMG